jgi:hypothetical protein
MVDHECFEKIGLDHAENATKVIHQLNIAVTRDLKAVLVDPDKQNKAVQENDPQKLIMRGAKIMNADLSRVVERAFETGLFSFSEIVFDSEHGIAIVAFSFDCGSLCGHGNTIILKKAGDKWIVSKECGGWVS